jgi:[acyl-carrier-protein] S-malonyltransferase
MGKDWVENFKEAAHAFEEASDFSGLKLKRLCFEGADIDLRKTEITQPAILTTTVAIWRSLQTMGALEGLYAGHSLGEYSALVCMGVLNLGEAARLVHHRGKYMQDAVPEGTGAMAAIVFKPKTDGTDIAQKICEEATKTTGQAVSVANFNSPEQIVISGYTVAVQEASRLSTTEKYGARKAVPLPVSAPFHCPLMRPAAENLAPEISSAKWTPQPKKYIANIDATLHPIDNEKQCKQGAERLVSQITGSVQWVRSIQTALQSGCTEAIEVGPGAVLSGLIKRISHNEHTLNVRNVDTWKGYKDAGTQL